MPPLRALKVVESFTKELGATYDKMTEYAGELKAGSMKTEDPEILVFYKS